jgi:thioredoxin reductase (NADPH)
VIVVGGGNSAGQAALFLSGIAKDVHHIVRGDSLGATMSQYLISRIERSRRITVYTKSEITALEGEASLKCVIWQDKESRVSTEREIGAVFVMIGAEPNSGWIFGTVDLDSKGFIITNGGGQNPFGSYATSMPGIFAVGDVRSNSVKRIASGVGEGSCVVSDVHHFLAAGRDSFATTEDSALQALRTANIPTPE